MKPQDGISRFRSDFTSQDHDIIDISYMRRLDEISILVTGDFIGERKFDGILMGNLTVKCNWVQEKMPGISWM